MYIDDKQLIEFKKNTLEQMVNKLYYSIDREKCNIDEPSDRLLLYETIIIKKFIKRMNKKTGKKYSVLQKERPTHDCKSATLKYLHDTLMRDMNSRLNSSVMSDSFHSYVKNRSIKTAAAPHTNKYAVLGIDIKDYFPSIKEPAMAYVLKRFGYKKDFIKKILTLTTIPSTDGRFQEYGELPQGTKYSGLFAGAVFYELDEYFDEYAKKNKLTYTRYSDNLYFSSEKEAIPIEVTDHIIDKIHSFSISGKKFFRVKKEKVKYMPYYKQQRICGVIVNKKTNISKRKESKTRSALHHLYNNYHDFISNCYQFKYEPSNAYGIFLRMEKRKRKVFGNLSHICNINEAKYIKYLNKVRSIEILSSEAKNMFDLKNTHEAYALLKGEKDDK